MLSAFGMMIIARHQLLIDDNSLFKMRPVMKYCKWNIQQFEMWAWIIVSYLAVNCVMHIMTVSTVLALIGSTRERQIIRLEMVKHLTIFRNPSHFVQDFPQLKWQSRCLNWFIFDGEASPSLKDFTYYAFFIAVPLFCAFIILPFIHMFIIIMRCVSCFFHCSPVIQGSEQNSKRATV